MVSVWHSASITRGFLDLLCSTTMGSVVRAIRVLRPFRLSKTGEVDLDMTVFRAVMCWSGISHLGGWWTTAGLEGVGGEYKSAALFDVIESCLLRQDPVGVALTISRSLLSREYRLSLSLPLYEGFDSKAEVLLDEDVRLSSKPCLQTHKGRMSSKASPLWYHLSLDLPN